jgi:hypothetical protein
MQRSGSAALHRPPARCRAAAFHTPLVDYLLSLPALTQSKRKVDRGGGAGVLDPNRPRPRGIPGGSSAGAGPGIAQPLPVRARGDPYSRTRANAALVSSKTSAPGRAQSASLNSSTSIGPSNPVASTASR